MAVIHYFDFCQGGDYIYHGTTEFIGIHNHSKLELNETQKNLFNCDKVADIFPEHYIINIKIFDDIATEPLDQWIYFLKNEEIKDEFQAKGLYEAKIMRDNGIPLKQVALFTGLPIKELHNILD